MNCSNYIYLLYKRESILESENQVFDSEFVRSILSTKTKHFGVKNDVCTATTI